MHRLYRTLAAALLVGASLILLPGLAKADSEASVTGNGVNFRTGPGTGYASIGKFYAGDKITVTGESGNWYAASASGRSGYVYKTYVRVSESAVGGDSAPSSVLRRGSTGSAVRQLQGNLIYLGYLNGSADGVFGAKTEAAVRLYQARNSLGTDGQAGSITNSAIQKEVLRVVNVIETAKKYLGTDYVYGGSSPATGFDCSGLTQYAFAQAGMTIPRVSYEQAKAGIAVPTSQMRPGDLVAFNSPVSHVGIYLGNNKFLHSPKTGDVVKITDLKYMNLTAVRRFTGKLVK